MGRFVASLLIAGGLVLTAAAAPVWAAAGTIYGQVVNSTGAQAPDRDDLTMVVMVNNSDEVIHTENAYNSPLGYKQGYQIHEGKGYCFINFGNFRAVADGQTYKAVITSLADNTQAILSGTIPGGYTGLTQPVSLQASAAPHAPKVSSAWGSQGVVVSWEPEAGVIYKMYRSILPSGAGNSHSNGVFQRLGEGANGSFTDTGLRRTQNAWYVVVPENAAGLLGAHSEEVGIAAEIQQGPEVKNPAISQPGTQLHNSGAIQEQGAPSIK